MKGIKESLFCLSYVLIIKCLYDLFYAPLQYIICMSKRDYYQVLGLTRQATEADIKKAYKKLAVRWHPDKNQNNKEQAIQKFREISEAYQNLSDPEKRKIYDTYGFEGPRASTFSRFDFKDADDLFARFFSSNGFDNDEGDFFSSFFNRRKGGKTNATSPFSSFFDGDDFFKGGFSSSSFSSGGFGGASKSVSTTTRTINGKTVTTKKTTITKQDGSKQVTEETTQNGKKTQTKYILGAGESENPTKQSLKYR